MRTYPLSTATAIARLNANREMDEKTSTIRKGNWP
jgi:hypothetical protein